MFTGMLHTHTLAVMLFLLLYLIKTTLLVMDKKESLQKFSKKMKVPEIIISTLFLLTGIYLAMNSGNIGTWFYLKMLAVVTSIPLAIIAFKRMNKSLAFIAIMFLVYSYGISETKSPTFKKEISTKEFTNASADVLGIAIYESKCVSCHGADGKLGKSGAYDLSVSVSGHEKIVSMITDGEKLMPAFKDVLSAEQINAVSIYVETLKK